MKRSPMPPRKTGLKRTGIARKAGLEASPGGLTRTSMSSKPTKRQSDFNREFEAMKPVVKARSRGYCESWPFVRDNCPEEAQDLYHAAPIAGTCQFKNPVHVHHRKYRKRGGTNSPMNLLHLCEPCHSWIHAHGKTGGPANLLGLALGANESEEL